MESFNDFHLFSFLPVLICGFTLWLERVRRHATPKRTKFLLLSMMALAGAGLVQTVAWTLKLSVWSQVFVLSGILYFLALLALEYAIHVGRIESSFLTDDFRREIRGLRPWLAAMIILAAIVVVVAPVLKALGFPHPIWGLVALYELALLVAASLAARRVFNLQVGVIRKRGYPFYAQMLVTVGLTTHLLFQPGAGSETVDFPLFWFTVLNLVYGVRLIEEFFFWTQYRMHSNAVALEQRQQTQNLLIRRVIGADADNLAIVRELVEGALEKAKARLVVEEYGMTGMAVYRAVRGQLRIDDATHIFGYCTPLNENKTVKSLDKTKLLDLVMRTTYDLAELVEPRTETLKDFGKKLILEAFESHEIVTVSELPEGLKGLHRLAIVVPIFDVNNVAGCLIGFKDSFHLLYPAERDVLVELAENLSTVYALIRGKEAQGERTRLQGEMNVARELQTAILPQKVELPGFAVGTFMETATEVGGDAFDFVPTPFGTYFGIGDVAGHGLPAGMMALISLAALHGALEASKSLGKPMALDQVYDSVNRVLCTLNRDRLGSDKFMTQNYFHADGGTISHVGTHLVALVWRAKTKTIEELTDLVDRTGFLGLSEFVVSTQSLGEFTMAKGDVLVLYSDGVIEAKNGRGDEFGLEGLKQTLAAHVKLKTPDELIAAVMDDLRRYAATGDLKKGRFVDDVSLVVLKKE